MKRALALGIIAFALAGCSGAVGEAEYPGAYVFESASGTETIEVAAGGTYKHRLEKDGSVVVDESGYWDNDTSGGNAGITFIGFQKASPELYWPGQLKVRGYWFVVPERSWSGKILLCIDEILCFEKRDD